MARLATTDPDEPPHPPAETAETAEASGGVRSVQRAFALVRCLTPDRPEATLTEFKQSTGLATSTVQRLLTTLEAGSILRRLPGGRYTFGSALIQVAVTALGAIELRRLVEPYLDRISSETGETANFAVLDEHGDVLYLRRTVSSHAIRHDAWLGRSIPAAKTAIGKVLTGGADARGLASTRKTIEPDVTAIAAPIYDAAGAIAGAISVTGPTFRIDDATLAAIGGVLAREAQAISKDIGGRWPHEARDHNAPATGVTKA